MLIEIIYLGMMPFLTLAAFIVHKLGCADMVEEFGGEKIFFGYPLIMVLWPLFAFVGILFIIGYVIFIVFNVIADKVVNMIKSGDR